MEQKKVWAILESTAYEGEDLQRITDTREDAERYVSETYGTAVRNFGDSWALEYGVSVYITECDVLSYRATSKKGERVTAAELTQKAKEAQGETAIQIKEAVEAALDIIDRDLEVNTANKVLEYTWGMSWRSRDKRNKGKELKDIFPSMANLEFSHWDGGERDDMTKAGKLLLANLKSRGFDAYVTSEKLSISWK